MNSFRDMQKLILITGILLSTGLWADMDYVCEVPLGEKGYLVEESYVYIEENCERNNVIYFNVANPLGVSQMIKLFCRYDRNVTQQELPIYGGRIGVTCILYSSERRKIINYD